MICPDCSEAGILLAEIAPAELAGSPARVRVKQLHSKCPGGNKCDCQHVLSRPEPQPYGYHTTG